MTDSIDESKRRFLRGATVTLGIATAGAVAYPFFRSMLPSRQALADGKPVRVKVNKMKPGDQLTVMWRGKPVWVVRRNNAMIKQLPALDHLLRDPRSLFKQQPVYAQNAMRSIEPEFLVVIGICTHLGCVPTYRPEPKAIDPQWPGGFFCSCHGSRFDLAGRVYKAMPATLNLEVPPYYFASSDEIVIGKNQNGQTADV